MSTPLVMTGPGGDYRTAIYAEHGRLVRRHVQASSPTGIATVVCPSALADPDAAAERLRRVLTLVASHRPDPVALRHVRPPHTPRPVVTPEPIRKNSHASSTQPDTQTVAHCPARPRRPRRAWLFADDAGTRRRSRRQQGDGLRARRSPDQKGRAAARAKQGTLFVTC